MVSAQANRTDANLRSSSIAIYPTSQKSPPPQLQQPDTDPSHCFPHISPIFYLPEIYHTANQTDIRGPSHLPSNSTPLHLSFHPLSSHSRHKSRNPSPRRVSPTSSTPPSPCVESAIWRGFKPAITLSPCESACRAMAMPMGEVQAVMSQVRGPECGGKVG